MDPGERSSEERIAALEASLAEVERRLAALEQHLRVPPPRVGSPAAPAASAAVPPVVPAAAPAAPVAGGWDLRAPRISAALILGWAGAAALVLAAAYLVRLGIVYGWITPARQVLATAGLGALMVGGGLALRLDDRPYASLLAAGGVAVLYLAVFGAHLYHHVIGAPAATALSVAIAILSLGLHAFYRTGIYVAFALAGSYATPLLVEGEGSVVELALYLAVWDLVYCAYGIWTGRRAVVVASLYASLIVFDVAWLEMGRPSWVAAALFQLFQFVLFVAVALAVAVRTRKAMGPGYAVLQLPALLLFYGFEYAILNGEAPELAPWAALGFVAALYAAWAVARAALGGPPRASLVTIHAFGALVLFHALYVDLLTAAWRPLAGLALFAVLFAIPRALPPVRRDWWPYHVAAGLLALFGWVDLAMRWGSGVVVAEALLAILYPATFYALYLERPAGSDRLRRIPALLVAHGLLLAGAAFLVERWVGSPDTTVEHLWLSLAWAAIGVVALATSLARRDRLLARSTLGIFLLFGLKVLVVDLEETSPLVRVGCLAVLGVSLYAGGWIYRRVLPPRETG